MKAQFLWSEKWEEPSLIAVDANAKVSVRDEGEMFLAAVRFPMQEGGVTRSEGGELMTTFHYLPEFMPSVDLAFKLNHDHSDYVTQRPHKTLAPSIRALLELADKWTKVDPKRRKDIHSETGWRDTMKVSAWEKKDNLRVRWLIAWQWPNLNRLVINGKTATNTDRAQLLNHYMSVLGWSESITPGTLKTTANRMELFFPE